MGVTAAETARAAAIAAAAVRGVRPPGLRRPGAIESPIARRRRQRAERRTRAIGVVAGALAAVVAGGELARVWSRGSAPLPAETNDLVGAAEEAVRETVAVAREGYRGASAEERALVNLLVAFTATFGIARYTTYGLRTRGRVGPFRNLVIADNHVHHFIPGIVLAFVSGAIGIVARDERIDPILAWPFGAGVALTLDESALLLKLDDVYWTEEGVVSVQIALATVAMLSAGALALRVLVRGERRVLDVSSETWRSSPPAPTTTAIP
ncbi:MAG: hypothetical protein JHC95_07085 [Solirubrobacteraceae bacterium]|nr:hypothetical protein [Solirubrobacteraceae bacterium]